MGDWGARRGYEGPQSHIRFSRSGFLSHLEKTYERESAVSRFENVKELIRVVKEYDAEYDVRPRDDGQSGDAADGADAAATAAAADASVAESSRIRLASFITEVVRPMESRCSCLALTCLFPSPPRSHSTPRWTSRTRASRMQ